MTNNKDKVLKALHDLAATCNDAAEGYGKAAKGVRDTDLSNWLAQVSSDRESYAADLAGSIRDLGDESRNDLHEGGILHRGWVDLEQRIRQKSDLEILQECVAGDTGTIKHYDHALTQDLSSDVRELVVEQRTGVEDVLVALEGRIKRSHSQHA